MRIKTIESSSLAEQTRNERIAVKIKDCLNGLYVSEAIDILEFCKTEIMQSGRKVLLRQLQQ